MTRKERSIQNKRNHAIARAAWLAALAAEKAARPVAPARRTAANTNAKPETLLSFLARKGGLAAHGDLKALDIHRHFVPGAGRLVRREGQGMTLDAARSLAEEYGFLPTDSDINTLLDAIGDEARGGRVVAACDLGAELDRLAQDEAETEADRRFWDLQFAA